MKCYYAFDEQTGQKFLIPGCMSVVQSNDIEDCVCTIDTFHQFEKERYNKVLEEKCNEIKGLYEEVIRLNKVIEKLHNKANEKAIR